MTYRAALSFRDRSTLQCIEIFEVGFFFFPVFFFQVFLKAVFGLVLFFKETAHRIILDFYHFTLLYSFLLAI